MAFPKQIPGSLDRLTLTPSSDKANIRESILQVWLNDYLLECFLSSTFPRIISVLAETFQKFLQLGGLQPPSPPPPSSYTYGRRPHNLAVIVREQILHTNIFFVDHCYWFIVEVCISPYCFSVIV